MSKNNKISFVLFSISLLLIALASIGAFKIGFDEFTCAVMYSVAAVLMDTALIWWIGFARFLKYVYLMFVFVIVIFCAVLIIASDEIGVWIGASVVAVLAVASLIPTVFKSR